MKRAAAAADQPTRIREMMTRPSVGPKGKREFYVLAEVIDPEP